MPRSSTTGNVDGLALVDRDVIVKRLFSLSSRCELRTRIARPQITILPSGGACRRPAHSSVRRAGHPNASFEFRHALLHDTAYSALLKADHERWRRHVAELAADGTLAIEKEMPELLATHRSSGGSEGAEQRSRGATE
jgi:hypothetical protein